MKPEIQTTHVIILDFEATCDDSNKPQPQEIIEFPSVLISLDSLETVAEFQSFVRPNHHPVLTEFCKNLTSITQADVDTAEMFPEVFAKHQIWLDSQGLDEENALFVSCGDWDLGTMLPAQCVASDPPVEVLRPIYTRWQNIKHMFCSERDRPEKMGMAGMLRDLGLPLIGKHHRGIDDCRNIAELYRALLRQGAQAKVTANLPLTKLPPITIQLRLGERVERARLDLRNMKTLQRLAGSIFKCKIAEFRRQDGSQISGDNELRRLDSGEEVSLS